MRFSGSKAIAAASVAALALAATAGGSGVSPLETRRSGAQPLASAILVSREAAAAYEPCCVTGIVTMASSWRPNSCVIAAPDDPNGPAVYVGGEVDERPVAPLEGASELSVGQVVEVEGHAAPFFFQPGIQARRIRLLSSFPCAAEAAPPLSGETPLPPAPERTLSDFAHGRRDNQRAAIRGVMMDVEDGRSDRFDKTKIAFARFVVATSEGTFTAHISGPAAPWRKLVDAEVRLTGCAMSYFSPRAEFTGIHLEIADPSGVEVLRPPPVADAFDLPDTPLDALFQRNDNHWIKASGVVTFARPGEFFYIQRGDITLKVALAHGGDRANAPVRAGDFVEAAGFPQMVGNIGCLVAAVYRVKSHGEPPAPITDFEDADFLPMVGGKLLNFDGKARVMVGRWVRMVHGEGEDVAYIQLYDNLVRIRLAPGIFTPPDDWDEWHPTVRVTGVCAAVMEQGVLSGRFIRVKELEMLVDDASGRGIEIVRDDIYRAHMREVAFAWAGRGAVALAAVGALVFLIRWRRQKLSLMRQNAIAAERKRMAADLHDTIEQHISGVRLLLNTARIYGGDIRPNVTEALETADGILARTKAEIREHVWNLRSDELFDSPPRDVLRRIAKSVQATGAVRVRASLAVLPPWLAGAALAEAVFIVQEAITNAVKHGRAKYIAIASDAASLSVANDGEAFTPDAALGPDAGHFGLAGMRERARRAGLAVTFEQRRKWMVLRLEERK